MSGYFSQLARHSGVGVEPGATIGAGGVAAEPMTAVPRIEAEAAGPLEVDEITVTAGAAPDADAVRSRDARIVVEPDPATAAPVSHAPGRARVEDDVPIPPGVAPRKPRHPDTPSAALREDRPPEPTEAPRSARTPPPRAADELSRADESPPSRTERGPDHEVALAPAPSEARARRTVPRESSMRHDRPDAASHDAGETRPTPNREQPANREQEDDGDTIMRGYLREVRAWVAASPTFEQPESFWDGDVERALPTERPRRVLDARAEPASRDDDSYAVGSERRAVASPAAPPAELEVQDLSLSIGTISIVVEEPVHVAPVAVPSPARADRSPAAPGPVPTRLSRYYLSRW